jgi:hypothetical protein
MVTEGTAVIGLDQRQGAVYAARVEHKTGRPEVKVLAVVDEGSDLPAELLENGRAVVAVPDNEVTVKRITLPVNDVNHLDLKIRFELAQSQLEDEEDFCFDIISTGRLNGFLGVIIRRTALSEIRSRLIGSTTAGESDAGWRVRAAALGRAYLAFCRREGGELVCLADFNGPLASLCFVFRDHIVALAHLALARFDLTTPDGVRSAVVELKTVLNFRLAALFQEGITLPLSGLIVCGEAAGEEFRSTLGEFFPAGITSPNINSGFFTDPSQLASHPPDSFLVALGLTVK